MTWPTVQCFSDDVIHHPLQLVFPDLVQAGDVDPADGRATRQCLLTRCAADGLALLTAHFPVDASLDVLPAPDGGFTVTSRPGTT